jgi:SAM-dependent methyltransferase
LLDQIWSLHAKLRALDMETAGFVNACASPARARPWVVIRAVSDYGTKESKKDGARPAAGAAAAVIAYTFIGHGLKRAHPLLVAPTQPPAPTLSKDNFFARMTMSEFLAKEVPRRFGVPFDDGALSRELTIYDLAVLYGNKRNAVRILDEIRELYFTTKYSDYSDEADVRRLTGSTWADEIMDIYEYLGIRLSNADILYVGVGNGRDLSHVCPKFNTLTGVDLSVQMLEKATHVQPQLKHIRDSAETLASITDESADLYLSLRTYQSSLFDIPSALRQAFRVLRRDGGFVISIPGGFLDRSDEQLRYVPGLLVPGSSKIVDRARPRRYAQEILTHLDRMTFSRVGFHQREGGDVYVYGRKA